METNTSARWEKFFNRYYLGDILALANEYPEKRSLYVDFVNIEKFDPDMAEELLEHPNRVFEVAEGALRNFALPIEKTLSSAHLRVMNLPQKVSIRDLRSIHISKLIAIEGLVRMATEVRPKLLVAAFECNGCHETMYITQADGRFVEPYVCKNEECGRKGPFKIKLTDSEFVDAQKLRVQESPEDLRGGEQPQTLDINTEDDLAGIVSPGDHVVLTGVLRSYQRVTREGKSTFFDIILDSVAIETPDKEFTEIEITAEEEAAIIELSKDPKIYESVVKSIAPSIYGYADVKEALALQLMSGVPKNLPDGTRIRGDMHVLLVGDPGIAKSQLLRYIVKLAPRGIYTSGRSSSAAGLCVAPDTRIQTSDGFFRIGDFVEARMQNPVLMDDGIWKNDCNSVSISTIDSNHTIAEKPLEAVWRLRAPGTMVRIETESGRSITATPATPFPVITDHGIGWIRSTDLTDQDRLVTPRLLPENSSTPYTIELFESNCTVGCASGLIAEIVSQLQKRYGTIREAASSLGISEDNLYYNWANEDARGNPDLRTLIRLAEQTGIAFSDVAQSCCWFSQQAGHKITLPDTLNEDFMYFVGLIAGDGSISRSRNETGYGGSQIRFSNSDVTLLEKYRSIIAKLFGLDSGVASGTGVRPPEIRFGSKIIAEILQTLGVPASPKSSRISLPDVVLNLPNNLIAAYLRGLFDTDGSCSARKSGSSNIQLYTTSRQLAEGVQLALLKFGIIGRMRTRPRDCATSSFVVDCDVKTITTSSDRYVVTIYGRENLTRYYSRIGFEHLEKRGNLVKILNSYKGESRSTNAAEQSKIEAELDSLLQLSTGDAFFDKVKSATEIRDHGYEYVYDLTISDTHNFVANSLLTHNTAAAVRDEFGDGRWTLEAGALVLADQGIAAVDEMDKMRSEDRSAIHEAMEQQSYHPSTEIMFSDGRRVAIGEFVDALIDRNRDQVEEGVDCEILSLDQVHVPGGRTMLALDWDCNTIHSELIDRVSRHKAPDQFIEIIYSNGRKITVTPEHPVYVMKDGEMVTVQANAVKNGMFAPIPNKYPLTSSDIPLQSPNLHNRTHDIDRRYKQISFPTHLDSEFGRLLGYIVSEGHTYHSEKNGEAEIMISNTDIELINDMDRIIQKTFNTTTYIQNQPHSRRKRATKDLYTVRCASILLYEFMRLNFMGVTAKSDEKRIPDPIVASNDDIKIQFLIGAFRGDGFYDSERFGYTTNSIGLATDYSDLLLALGIYSYISKSFEYESKKEARTKVGYKVVISGEGSQRVFYDLIGKHDARAEKINWFVARSKNKLNDRDSVPVEIAIRIKKLLKDYRLDTGYFNRIIEENNAVHRMVALKYINRVESCLSDIQLYNVDEMGDPREIRKRCKIPIPLIAERMDLSESMVTYIERNPSTKNAPILLEQIRSMAKEKIKASEDEIESIKRIVKSDIRFARVKSVSKVQNNDFDWVYDVTVEPNHTFVSNGLVLHNTISIAKAGIMATLKSRCSLLGAANPKYGRFDPYEGIAQQIKMAPALLSRFDLIFVLKDEPDVGRDSAIAAHILGAHHAGELHAHRINVPGSEITPAEVTDAMEVVTPEIDPDILRKYVAYAKRKVYPILNDDARDRLIGFYLGLRKQGEDRDSPVPVTARQLEALVRLCEASARIRLSEGITIDDAERVIRIVESCLRQVAYDAETGMFDADIITTGVSKSQRDKIKVLRNIIRDLEAEHSGMAPKEDVYTRAEAEGFDKAYVEEVLGRLKTQGELYEPTPEYVRLT